MPFRRLILPVVALLLSSCADVPPPSGAVSSAIGPRMVRWAPAADLQFEAVVTEEVTPSRKPGNPIAHLTESASRVIATASGLAPAVDAYTVSFWSVNGKTRSVQINYVKGTVKLPFLRFTASEPEWVPGRGRLEDGDSVLVTIRVDSLNVGARFEPAGLQFDDASVLKIWYGGIGGDLNGDGLLNGTDGEIEKNLLGLWYRQGSGSAWSTISATRSLTEKSFTSNVYHFSEYAVSW